MKQSITEHKIKNIKYIVHSASSDNAMESIDKKIGRLIRKEIEKENIVLNDDFTDKI